MLEDLEPQAAAQVGQLVFSFSRLDFMLGLALRNLLSTHAANDLNPLIERLSFKERIESLRELVDRSKSLSREAAQQFEAWYQRADSLRVARNAFVHGRWGIQTQDTLFNASTKVGKAFAGEAKIYSIEEIATEAAVAKRVLDEFYDWHYRNIVNAV